MCSLGESENGNTIYHTIDQKSSQKKTKGKKNKLLLISKIVVVHSYKRRRKNKYKTPSGLSFLVAIASGTIYPSRAAIAPGRNRFSLFSGARQTTLSCLLPSNFGSVLVTVCAPVNHHMLCFFLFSLFIYLIIFPLCFRIRFFFSFGRSNKVFLFS